MSHPINDAWLEAAIENFEEALEGGQWDMVHNIMADVRDNGFEDAWKDMYKRYNHERFNEQ